jgi:hypothetical protein
VFYLHARAHARTHTQTHTNTHKHTHSKHGKRSDRFFLDNSNVG